MYFEKRPILCTTLYRKPMQAPNLVADLTNFLPLNFFMRFSHKKIPLYLFYTMIQKKSKMTKKSNQGGGGDHIKTEQVQTKPVDLGCL